MNRMKAENRAFELSGKEPRSSGLTFMAKPNKEGTWYVAGYHKGVEVNYVRED